MKSMETADRIEQEEAKCDAVKQVMERIMARLQPFFKYPLTLTVGQFESAHDVVHWAVGLSEVRPRKILGLISWPKKIQIAYISSQIDFADGKYMTCKINFQKAGHMFDELKPIFEYEGQVLVSKYDLTKFEVTLAY